VCARAQRCTIAINSETRNIMGSKSISEWCKSHKLKSRGTFYKLKREGRAPDHFYPGPRISDEADERWVREREREAAAATRKAADQAI
jgi:hypothetical protein